MSSISNLAARLYRGEAGIDVVGKRKIWYSVAGVILVVALLSFWGRGFQLGIDFEGGNTFQVPVSVGSIDRVSSAASEAGANVVTSQRLGGSNPTYQIKTADLPADKAAQVKVSM